MADKIVELPDGQRWAFPDTMSDDDIGKIIQQQYQPKVRPRLPQREPSLIGEPFPETPMPGAAAPELPEMSFIQRAPLEVGLPALGGIAAGALSGPAAPAAVPLASGALQLAGSELNKRVVAPALGVQPPPPSFSQDPMREAALQFGTGTVSELVPGALKYGARRLILGPSSPEAQQTLRAMRELGVEPKMTDVAGGRGPGMVESAMRQTVPGSLVLTPKMVAQQERLATAAREEFLNKLGPDLAFSDVGTGGAVQHSIERNVERLKSVENQMWQSVTDNARGVTVTPIGFVGWANEVLARTEAGLESAQNRKTIRLAKNILRDATQTDASGTTRMVSIPFARADIWRKDIGQVMDQPELISGFDQGRLKNLYGQGLGDIETAIQYTGNQELSDAFTRVRSFGRQIRELYRDSQVAKVVDLTPEEVVSRVQSAKGATVAQQWKDAILGTPGGASAGVEPPSPESLDAWDTARRHVLESILGETSRPGTAIRTDVRGLPIHTPVISGRKLESELAKIGEEKLAVLLNPAERQALKNVQRVASAIDRGTREGAAPMTSITGQNMRIQSMLTAAAGGAGAGLGNLVGHPVIGGMVGTFVGSVLAPHAIAKALVNPKAVDIMATTGFARLAKEFQSGQLTREGVATILRLLSPEVLGESSAPGVPESP